jgi:hypothetical protein
LYGAKSGNAEMYGMDAAAWLNAEFGRCRALSVHDAEKTCTSIFFFNINMLGGMQGTC